MTAEHWGAVAVVVASLIAYFGVRYTSQQSTKAQQITEVAEEKAIDAAAYQRARDSYESAISRYLAEIDRLQERINVLSARIDRLNRDVAELEKTRITQRAEIEKTVTELIQARHEYEEHLRECRRTVASLRAQLNEFGV